MKIEKPAETIEVCDRCRRDGFLNECDACGAAFCLTCEGGVAASWGFTHICRACGEREDVREICASYAEKLTPIFAARNAAIKRLRKRGDK